MMPFVIDHTSVEAHIEISCEHCGYAGFTVERLEDCLDGTFGLSNTNCPECGEEIENEMVE